MSSDGSVTQWIGQVKAGDREAARRLWECYFDRLVRLARKKLQGRRKRVADEEDAALSAFDSFCRGAEQGHYPNLKDRHGLWPLLVVITHRKVIRQAEHEQRQKRGGGAVRGESVFCNPGTDADSARGFEQVLDREPTPEFAFEVTEEFERLLGLLATDELRSIALWKMEGHTNAEIARKLDCVEKTVERKLRVIRTIWGKEDCQ